MKYGKAMGCDVKAIVAPSQGVHLVVECSFLPGNQAMLIHKTTDGRVLFAVLWLGKTTLGTTDTLRGDVVGESLAFKKLMEVILTKSARYLTQAPSHADIRSILVGLRPLFKPANDDGDFLEPTQSFSREHTVLVRKSGLVTVAGGKRDKLLGDG
jgi:glycerol-3-phosphate dehydrogenase